MGQLGQSPPNYQPEFTQLVDGQNVEHVRKGPEGLVGNDGTNDRAIWGYQKGGFEDGDDFGFKISQRGVRVQDATPDQLIMSSAFNMFKIVATDTASFTKLAGDTLGFVNIPHGLGYAPIAVVYYGLTTANPLPTTVVQLTGPSAGATSLLVNFATDATNLVVNAWTPDYVGNGAFGADVTIDFRYYILKETAE